MSAKKKTAKKVARKRGRPSKYSPQICEEICRRLAEGEPLTSICRDDHMPAWRTVDDWRVRYPDFSADVGRARDHGFHRIAADCLEIADDREEEPASRRVRVETRLKLLACWDPRRYGNKLDVDFNEAPIIKVTIGGDAT